MIAWYLYRPVKKTRITRLSPHFRPGHDGASGDEYIDGFNENVHNKTRLNRWSDTTEAKLRAGQGATKVAKAAQQFDSQKWDGLGLAPRPVDGPE